VDGARLQRLADSSDAATSLWGIGRARLTALLGAVAAPGDHGHLLRAFDDLTPWARSRSLLDTAYRSSVADDGAPFEFCVAFGNDLPPEVQVYVEPLAEPPSTLSNLRHGFALLQRVATRYDLCLDRLTRVQDLVFPEHPEGAFALWLGVSGIKGRLSFKCYVNPQISGAGAASRVTSEVLGRLGFAAAWSVIVGGLVTGPSRRDEISILSFDLQRSSRARVKVYIRHHHATVSDLDKRMGLARDYQCGDAERFYGCLSGASNITGTFSNKPPIVELSFVDPEDCRPASSTLEFPIGSYVESDLEARQRIERCLDAFAIDPAPYRRAISAFAPRPLEDGVGIHAHVTLRRVEGGKPRLAVYFASEAHRSRGVATVSE
jgi:hypothetical protein